MYLKKVDGPRTITLPDGKTMTRADLPPKDTRRWVASRKSVVVKAVLYGLLERSDALNRYAISDEEFDEWVTSMTEFGESALRATIVYRNDKRPGRVRD